MRSRAPSKPLFRTSDRVALRALTFDKGLNGSMGTVAAIGNFLFEQSRADGSENRVENKPRMSISDEQSRRAQVSSAEKSSSADEL